MATASSGSTNVSYTYDADGLRTSKTVNGVVYNYYYVGSQLARMTYGDNVLDFFYDINGVPIAMRHGYASSANYVVYYYITNLQGDVIRLVDVNGNTAAYYEYDPYGNAIQAAGSHANVNPLRYRGYVYDTDTGFYYLQSRYYDSSIGRFINRDDIYDEDAGLQGYNLFVYCGNNPVRRVDISGADSVDLVDGEMDEDDPHVTDGCGNGTSRPAPTGNPSGNGGSNNGTGLIYENASYHTPRGNSVKSPCPIDGQAALDNSVQVKPTSPRRIGVSNNQFVVLDQTRPGVYHGHVRTWSELNTGMQRALVVNGLASWKGKML